MDPYPPQCACMIVFTRAAEGLWFSREDRGSLPLRLVVVALGGSVDVDRVMMEEVSYAEKLVDMFS
jgi:hypothetical protein